jgi:Mechanosensitive ion channel, conserved TM helix
MWEMIVGELNHAMQELARNFAHLLPRLLATLIIALLGWVIAYALKVVVRGILRIAKFDKLSDNAGATQILNKLALPSSSELLSRVVFWVVWLGFILLGVQVLGIVGLQEHISRFFLYLPRLFVALFIVFFGLVAANFFSRAALLAAVNADSPSPGLLATLIRTIIVIFAVTMAFEQLRCLDARPRHCLWHGWPGSGKTIPGEKIPQRKRRSETRRTFAAVTSRIRVARPNNRKLEHLWQT